MNLYFMSTNRRFWFNGSINEDTNTYTDLGTKGELMFQTSQVALEQMATQANKGGLTEFYLDSGTYVKSFYTILCQPSCCKLILMGNKYKRIHHCIKWNNTAPKILNDSYRKV